MRTSHRLAAVAVIGVSGVVAAARYEPAPPRYLGHLDPPGYKGMSFQRGKLVGWQVFVYNEGKRIVCVNPFVYDGTQVITCDHVVTVDAEVPTGPDAPFPSFEDTGQENVRNEIELWQKRLTRKTNDEKR